jgi:hypothetical protein
MNATSRNKILNNNTPIPFEHASETDYLVRDIREDEVIVR